MFIVIAIDFFISAKASTNYNNVAKLKNSIRWVENSSFKDNIVALLCYILPGLRSV